MVGAFLALDLFLFYVFWELMLIPMYVMIGVWGGQGRIKSAIKFFLYTMFGSMLMLGAIIYVAHQYSRASGGTLSFDFCFEASSSSRADPRHICQCVLCPHRQDNLAALGGLHPAAFVLIKVPMWPVHTAWLPDAHTEAPTAGSIILALAVMLKMGTYGYLRFSMELFPRRPPSSP